MGQVLQQGSAFGSGTARATAGDRIYHAIKASVIAYAFPEGKRIYLEPIAEDLNVSTTPVREALNRLAAEGLVIKAPRKGFLAMSLSADKLLGHYELTKLLLVHELEGLGRRRARPAARARARCTGAIQAQPSGDQEPRNARGLYG